MIKDMLCKVCGTEKVAKIEGGEDNYYSIAKTVIASTVDNELNNIRAMHRNAAITDCWCPECGIKYHPSSV